MKRHRHRPSPKPAPPARDDVSTARQGDNTASPRKLGHKKPEKSANPFGVYVLIGGYVSKINPKTEVEARLLRGVYPESFARLRTGSAKGHNDKSLYVILNAVKNLGQKQKIRG